MKKEPGAKPGKTPCRRYDLSAKGMEIFEVCGIARARRSCRQTAFEHRRTSTLIVLCLRRCAGFDYFPHKPRESTLTACEAMFNLQIKRKFILRKEEMKMALIRWDPFREMTSVQERMKRVFDDLRDRTGAEEVAPGAWVPPIDIHETPESLVLKAELPGLKREDISIELQDGTLILKGEKRFARDVNEENYRRIERTYGAFQRSFTLPGIIKQDGVKAKFNDGILEITLPKAEEAKPRQVKVD
jgi:HSP20 family protein